uniref:Transmembrane protein n=1 Tax=Steinernema glaseri TaxID=37863 RepID=A0A1I7Z7L3_9BILA
MLSISAPKVDTAILVTVFVAVRSFEKSTTINFALGALLGAIVVSLFCAIAFCVRSWPNFSPLESSDSMEQLAENEAPPATS